MNIDIKSISANPVCKKCSKTTNYIGEVNVYGDTMYKYKCEYCKSIQLKETKFAIFENVKSVYIDILKD